jgi:6-phosphofructokinase 1
MDVVYANIKQTYFGRIERSDVRAGAYMMVVAEGIRDANGEMLYDDSVAADAFGHKKLAGAGRYVKQQIERRLKDDPDVREFMKGTGMFVPGVYEIPEVRDIIPSHLVRSGDTSAYDVNFGYRTGAAAVLLLLAGESGKTVVKVEGRKIHTMETEKVIKRRDVNLDEVALFESLGTCFGRKPEKFEYSLLEERRVGI